MVLFFLNNWIQGKFRWLFRKRVRVTLIGDKIYKSPTELHDQQLNFLGLLVNIVIIVVWIILFNDQLENRFMECLQERDAITPAADQPEEKLQNKRVLAIKALNEVMRT